MKIDELEKYLQSLLDTDFQVRASQDKVIILNNMLAACRSLLSLENICNSETLNDNYKVFITSSMNNFSSSFVTAAFQRLAQLNIGGNSMPGFSFPNMNMYQQVPVAPVTPVVPMAPMPQPFQQPMQPQPMPQPQFFQQPPQPQPMPQPQPVSPPPVVSQPEAPQVQAQPQPQAPQPTPQPAAAAPQPAPVAPAAPVEEEEEDSSDESEVSAPSSGGSSNISFDVGLPGIGGGHDGPADGRDYLLSLLSKK